MYEADRNYDSDYAADSGYGPCSDEGDSACGSDASDASETGTIRPEDLICEENGRKYHTYGISSLGLSNEAEVPIELMFRQAVLNTGVPAMKMLRISWIWGLFVPTQIESIF